MRKSGLTLLVIIAALAVVVPLAAAPHPEAVRAPAQADDATVLFRVHCAACHDVDGRGNGRAAANLRPAPPDLSLGLFRRRTTPSGGLPTDDDILRVLRKGIPGSAMPGFNGVLTTQQLRDLVEYVKTLSPRFSAESAPPPVDMPPAPLGGEAAVSAGKDLYAELNCGGCHGPDARGNVAMPADARGRVEYTADFGTPWMLHGGGSAEDLYRAIDTGVDGTAMPAYADKTSEGQRWSLVYYLRSLSRTPLWSQSDPARVRALPTGGLAEPVQRGEYLVRALGCGQCHTPMNSDGTYDTNLALGGGTRITAWPYGVFYSPNLTPGPTGLAGWSQNAIARALTSGQVGPLGIGRLNAAVMPWPYYARMRDEDALAIAAYLRSLPPVYNAVPAADGFGFFGTFGGKLQVLMGAPVSLEMAPGNAGVTTPGENIPLPSVSHRLSPIYGAVVAMLLTLLCYAADWFLGRGDGAPTQKNVLRGAAFAVYAVVLGAYIAVLATPLYTYFPREAAAAAVVRMPQVQGISEPGKQAYAERGLYLATIAGCGICHSVPPSGLLGHAPAPLSGGVQFNWSLFGTRYSRNLTPGPTGLNGWSDDDIKRALQSGQSRDGRLLQWQVMPWDFYANFNDEDAEAIAVYLMAIAPQNHSIPPPDLPAAGDLDANRVIFADHGQ